MYIANNNTRQETVEKPCKTRICREKTREIHKTTKVSSSHSTTVVNYKANVGFIVNYKT